VSRIRWGARGADPPSRTGSGKLRGPRKLSLISALALAAALVGGAAGLAAASGSGGTQAARLALGLNCRFPSSSYQVSAVVAASFPDSTGVGKPIQPVGLQVSLRLPQAVVASLRKLAATSVTASGLLGVTEVTASKSTRTQWPDQTSAASQLPATGSLQIAATGSATPTMASAAGTVTFAATSLDIVLSAETAAGKATSPATVKATCVPGSGASTQLASVVVAGAAASPSPSVAPSQQPSAKGKVKYPKHCGDIPIKGHGVPVCGYIVGFTNVRKQYGAAKLGPGLVNIDFAYKDVIKGHNAIEYSTGQLYYQGTETYYKGHEQLPPAHPTFLTFGFVPVTATLVLIERVPINIVSVSQLNAPPYRISVTATTKVAIHVSNVTVNGVPLDVGPACQAEHLATLKLFGHGTNLPPTGYTVPTGGPLAGFVKVPPFIDCGVTENLNPLLTGTISGSRNYVKMTQGKLCGPTQPQNWTCPPPVPKPIR
jgi:hypothetical protein